MKTTSASALDSDRDDEGNGAALPIGRADEQPKVDKPSFGRAVVTWRLVEGAEASLKLFTGSMSSKKDYVGDYPKTAIAGKDGVVTFNLERLRPESYSVELTTTLREKDWRTKELKPRTWKKEKSFYLFKLSLKAKPIRPKARSISPKCDFSDEKSDWMRSKDFRVWLDASGAAIVDLSVKDLSDIAWSKDVEVLERNKGRHRIKVPVWTLEHSKTPIGKFYREGLRITTRVGHVTIPVAGKVALKLMCYYGKGYFDRYPVAFPGDGPKTSPMVSAIDVGKVGSRENVMIFTDETLPLTQLDYIGKVSSKSKDLSSCSYKSSSGKTKWVTRTRYQAYARFIDRRDGVASVYKTFKAKTPRCSSEVLGSRSSFVTFVDMTKVEAWFNKKMVKLK